CAVPMKCVRSVHCGSSPVDGLCCPYAFLGSNEATYGLREGGAGLHRNRPELARLNQHFRQASFAEFEMLMGFDDEVLKRYGLPKPMVERARPSSSWSSTGGNHATDFDGGCVVLHGDWRRRRLQGARLKGSVRRFKGSVRRKQTLLPGTD